MNKKGKCLSSSILALAGFFLLLAITGCASSPAAGTASRPSSEPPLWLSNPDLVYPSTRYVAAVGSGTDLEAAEKSALSSLAGIFGQSVSGDVTVSSRYAARMANERILETSSVSSISEKITTAVKMDTLVGASIKETWTDTSGRYVYAIAVMDKAETSVLYSELIRANDSLLETLSERQGLSGFAEYSRLRLMAETAEATEALINVLAVVNPAQAAAMRASRTSTETYRMRLASAAAAISISINIENDRLNLLTQAFSDVLSGAGFRAASSAERANYALDGTLFFQEVEMTQNSFTFSRGVLNASLADSETGEALLTFSASAREGHNSLSEAENRAARTLASRVKQEFADSLDAFLISGF